VKRRDFGRLGGVGSLFSVAGARAAPAPGAVAEPARETPVVSEGEVVVCGAGPAGVCAAIAAARRGARTKLLEVHGALGGIWTSGLLAYILDFNNKSGLMAEIVERAAKQDGRAFTKNGTATCTFDPEILKIVLEEMCAEAGVQVQFHSRVCAVTKNSAGRLTHVITESKSGREAVGGRIFVDCTGDGDLGARAGCGFDWGHPETGAVQPMSLIALVTGIQAEEVEAFFREEKGEWAKPKDALRAEMTRGGQSPSYAKPSLFRLREDLFILMSNHEYEVKGIDVRDVTAATLRARKELHAQINGLRSLGGVWKNIRIVATPAQIGVREGRRLHGLYTVCADDLREGRSQPDAVCKATFPVDVHSTNPKKEKGIESAGFRAKPYDIPLRSLIARDVTGLMMAGRCISGDFLAHSSYRVTGNAAAMGEAAGAVAAIAAKTSRLPQDVSLKEIT
jgi:hypothetical protein